MDRRQQRSREAILSAFSALLGEKSYHSITVQDIIDLANVGRSTFYAHFETKDALLQELCRRLFGHIVDSARDAAHTHGTYSDEAAPPSVFCHLLHHLAENDYNVLGLLSGESSGIFMRYFKDSLAELVREQCLPSREPEAGATAAASEPPEDFLVNHVAGSFVDMVLWWIRGGMRETPEQLDQWFRAVNAPALG